MLIRIFLAVVSLAVFAAGLSAQNQIAQKATGPNAAFRSQTMELSLDFLLEKDDDDTTTVVRPRIVAEKPVRQSDGSASGENTTPTRDLAAGSMLSVEKEVFDKINQIRQAAGLKPLRWNDSLERVARLHSENMAIYQFFGHRDPDGKVVSDRADREGMGKWDAIGENIAFNRGYKSPTDQAVGDWMDSAPHKQNLLDERWKEAAIGVAQAADGSFYFTQVFMIRK